MYYLAFLIVFVLSLAGTVPIYAEPVLQYPNAFDRSLLAEIKAPNSPLKSGQKLRLYSFELNYADPANVRQSLLAIYPDISIAIDARRRTVHLHCSRTQYRRLSQLVARMDQPLRQIQFEVQMIEVSSESLDAHRHLLSHLSNGIVINYDFESGKVVPLNGFLLELSGLIQNGQAKLLAKPTITSQDNHPSKIKVGDQLPYVTTLFDNNLRSQEIHYLDTGIELNLHPKISSPNQVVVDIDAMVSTVKLWREFGQNSYPLLSKRSAKTQVELSHNITLVIGGLLDEMTNDTVMAVPLLSKLPVFGRLFKKKTITTITTDIIFLVTPTLL